LDLADLVTQVENSVVNISTFVRSRPSDEDKRPKQISIGSGFFIRSDGYVVTTSSMLHEDEESYMVTRGSKQVRAQVVGKDAATDVAVLKVDGAGWQSIRAADMSKLRTGQRILLVGSAFAGMSTVADGIVSHHDRHLPGQVAPFIAVSVPIYPGNGGAPIFNLQGEALGMVSLLYVATKDSKFSNVPFAVPMDTILATATAIIEHGRVVRGAIRVTIQDVTDELSKAFGLGDQPRGALVAGVAADGPAARAGIVVGDIILEFDRKPVKRSSDIPQLVGSKVPGSKVPVVVFRRGKMLELTVDIEELKR
jgi:serine protease Do